MMGRNPISLGAGVAVLALLAGSAVARGQAGKEASRQPAQNAEMQAQMQAEMQAATPGPAHQQLARRTGEYSTATKFWVQPGAAPLESAGTAKLSMILGGRFLSEEDSGTFAGHPTSGMRLYGYNNGPKKYESVWVWTSATGILTLSGSSTDEGRTVNYIGSYDDASGSRQLLLVTVRQIDDDHFITRIRGADPEAPHYAVLETTYTRKK